MCIAALVTRFDREFLEADVGGTEMAINAQHHALSARIQAESLQRDRPISVSESPKVRNRLDEKVMKSGRKRESKERRLKVVTIARSDHWSCPDRSSLFPNREGLREIVVLSCNRDLVCLGHSNALLRSRCNHAEFRGV